ncbi:DEAD/DEAH box helicase family protein [Pseudonocardia abyssalis]|uniref:DEAD/DEAH box helicase family protein n=1 Tax=Pseudonocardia abyssalis TaxID=2792008 RepID=A0ABS6UY80_9PSEU|nr:DEAD/DEAH box helicase family protein [Pseudonocardia abyssalis]MBW0114105.1 DEAD/DEAH box helicase family protein [Pseudonocardia abyssalis]MBW0136664.1 DEAD/DEAH box helicase family protein [Pseudonocardia abyssalis]
MGNFDFAGGTLPTVHPDCARAEAHLSTDPRSACFYSRRAVEGLVKHLYDVMALKAPYKNDLAARIDDAAFKAKVGVGIAQKLTLIRKLGNTAVHEQKPVPPRVALDVLRELHHVVVWAAFRYSTDPQAVPTQAQFDPALASKAAPLTREEVQRLAAKFVAQDEAHAKEIAEKDELSAAKDAEISLLREQIAAAQAANTKVDDHDYTEAQTRDLFIDLLLREAGWPLDEARDREYPVTGMPNNGGTGKVDYVLWGADGRPLAIVEAKRTTKSAGNGQQQAKLYADCLEQQFDRRPVIFYTNGYEHWLWDDGAGYPPREVQGFLNRDELELMIQRRDTRLPLSGSTVDTTIVERPYQHEAIQAVGAAFDEKQREALLVMATGSGKTRTVIALIDQLMKAGWVKRVLFLADRTALVNQATNAFKAHLPGVTTVNLVTEKAVDGRVYTSTYPTMLNLINATDGGLRRFGPGHFDLVVIDEAHRSVYQKYGAIFDWFDGLLIGLTATPKDEVDHNTYRLFNLEDGVPTSSYGLGEAVRDKFLVPPRGVAVGTKFLRHGIRYADLSTEEKDEWDALDWGDGDVPDEVGAEELNRFLFNEDTVDKVLANLMDKGHKVSGGDLLGKTIVFAKNQAHAEFIQRRFDVQWPHLAGEFARMITHGTAYAQKLIDDFSTTDKSPHIAISVDMLDTGIDVPDVVNLVFFKTVRSKSKFWQMLGRGTRLRRDLFGPGVHKSDFYVFDFCGNLEFFSQDLPGSEGSLQKSLTQRLFEARLGLIRGLDTAGTEEPLRASTTEALHRFVAGMTLDNVLVRPHRKWVERYTDGAAWTSISDDDVQQLLTHLAGLPSTDTDEDEQAKRFDLIVLRRQLAQLDGDAVTAERLREQVQEIAAVLLGKQAIPSVAEQLALLDAVSGDEWWIDVTLPMLEFARLRIRGLVRFVEKGRRNPVYTDFADELSAAVEIDLPGVVPGTNPERYRAKAAAYFQEHEDHVSLQRLRRNKQLTPDDLLALEEMLLASGAGPVDASWVADQGLGVFIRSIVGLDHQAATEAFGHYLDGSRFTVHQIRFVHLIINELTSNGVVEPRRLFESPYTDHAPTGPDALFPEADVEVIVDILHEVRNRARAGVA